MSETIVVTGANGIIPKSAVQALTAAGARVRVLSRKAATIPGVETVVGDLDRPETLASAFKGAGRLFLVTNAGPDMVAKHRHALEAAQAAGVQKVVRVSAWGASADAPVALGRWHAELDSAFGASGLRYVSLQPHGFFQNTLGYAASVKSDGAIYAPLGQGRVCYLDAEDIGRVAARTLLDSSWDGQQLSLSGPEAFSYEDLAQALSQVLGRTIRYVDVPPEAARTAMLAAQFPEWLVNDLLGLSQLYAANLASTPSPTVAQALGHSGTRLSEFLSRHRAAFGG